MSNDEYQTKEFWNKDKSYQAQSSIQLNKKVTGKEYGHYFIENGFAFVVLPAEERLRHLLHITKA